MTQNKTRRCPTTIVGGRTGSKGSRDRSAASDGEADHSIRYQRQGAAGGKTVAKVLRSDARGKFRHLISSGTSARYFFCAVYVGVRGFRPKARGIKNVIRNDLQNVDVTMTEEDIEYIRQMLEEDREILVKLS
ncbi:MAG: hypothetical protein U9N46_14505 [Euryarchaeota archaeon]|nr:hypothetical protein [Euryarchaeota archaeon]